MMPIWIRVVYFKVNNPKTKKTIISLMVFIFLCFIGYISLKQSTPHSFLDTLIKLIAKFVLLTVTLISAYYSWPRSKYESIPQKKYFDKTNLRARKNSTKELVSIPFMSGTNNSISVFFYNATFIRINNSSLKYPDQDFGAWIIEEIYEKRKIFTESVGYFRKKQRCPQCKTEINFLGIKTHEVIIETGYKDLPPMTIKVLLPSVICLKCEIICGVETKGSSPYFLNEAILDLFETNKIRR